MCVGNIHTHTHTTTHTQVALGRADDEQQAAEGDSSSVNGSSVIVAEKRQAFVNLLRPFVVQLMAHVAGLECDVHGW